MRTRLWIFKIFRRKKTPERNHYHELDGTIIAVMLLCLTKTIVSNEIEKPLW